MPSFARHVFVCINERAADHPKGCCKAKGGVAVRDRLKSELTARGLSKTIRANNAGCLDQCERGVTVTSPRSSRSTCSTVVSSSAC